MQTIINELLQYFTTKTRGTGDDAETIVILKDNAPEYLRANIMEAHGDRMPNDWIYEKYHSILETLSGYIIGSMDDVENYRAEIVDGLVDIYNADRTAWLASHLDNAGLCDEAEAEFGAQDTPDMFQRIGVGQYYAIDQIYSHVAGMLETLSEDNTNGDAI